jgi:XisI protein
MDKVNQYQQIVCKILTQYASIKKTLTPDVKTQLLIDKEHHHYQLLSIGWHRNRFVYTISFHFDIIEGKIWIQQNNTDCLIADELVELGIPKSDIILGFIHDTARAYTGFGQA